MYVQWEEFWWNEITGPHRLIESVADALADNKIVVLNVPYDLPWRHTMRNAVCALVREKIDNSDLFVESIDAEDDVPQGMEPGRYILDRFADESVAKGYRSTAKNSIQQYIVSNNVIKDRLIWIKGLPEMEVDRWLSFCRGFAIQAMASGTFVIEISKLKPAGVAKCMVFDYSDYISNYDLQLFSNIIMDARSDYSVSWKNYAAMVVAKLCGTDAEIAERLLRTTDFKGGSVLETLKEIADDKEYVKRGSVPDSQHVLWYSRNGGEEELRLRIWAAQVQVLFPIIELERIQFISENLDIIAAALKNNTVMQFNEIVTNAMDIELGTLCYMMKHWTDDGSYILVVPDETKRHRIQFLHECRNLIAHVDCCSPKNVAELLG